MSVNKKLMQKLHIKHTRNGPRIPNLVSLKRLKVRQLPVNKTSTGKCDLLKMSVLGPKHKNNCALDLETSIY